MKKVKSALFVAGALFVMNVQRPPVADKAIITAAQPVATEKGKTYKLDLQGSSAGWVGTKPSGKHTGTLKFSAGALNVKKDNVTGGSFTIDMTSITDTDLEGRGKEGLEKHLKGADFFDVEKFPTATFEITGITPIGNTQNVIYEGATHNIAGNMTLKGITKNVSFPAAITVAGKSVSASADFNIDRTEWGISYGVEGGKVAKEINLKLDIKANK